MFSCLTVDPRSLVADIVDSDQHLVATMANELDTKRPDISNWKDLAYCLGVSRDVIEVIEAFVAVSDQQELDSPTMEIMHFLAARKPLMTIGQFVKALEEIHHYEAIQIITQQLPETVGE